MNAQLFLNMTVAAAHCALVAVGFSLIYRTVRFFHFAHAVVYTIAAYGAFVLGGLAGDSVALPVLFAVGLGTLLGGTLELAVYRPIRRIGGSATGLLVASLGVLVVLQSGVSLLFGDDTKALKWGTAGYRTIGVAGARISTSQVMVLAGAVVSLALLGGFLRFTRWGRLLRAVASDASLAQILGVHLDRVVLAAFLIGSALAALAGVLWAFNTALSPTMGFTALLLGVVAAVVGGIVSLPGAIIGSLLVSAVHQFAQWRFPSEWQDAIVYVVLVVVLLIRPQGIMGKPSRRASL